MITEERKTLAQRINEQYRDAQTYIRVSNSIKTMQERGYYYGVIKQHNSNNIRNSGRQYSINSIRSYKAKRDYCEA